MMRTAAAPRIGRVSVNSLIMENRTRMKLHCLGNFGRLALAVALTIGCLARAAAQSQPEIEIRAHGERATYSIAVPEFDHGDSQPLEVSLARVIENDLKLSGYFSPPANSSFSRETHQADLISNSIDFAEWYRIGVSFLVRGQYQITDGEIVAEVKIYDTVSGVYVTGTQYSRYPIADARRLAHVISDDIIKRLLDVEGFATTQLTFVRQLDPFGRTKQVCVMDQDGFNIRPLTGSGQLTATPTWGAKGTEIYYTTWADYNPDLAGIILKTGQTWWISREGGLNLSPDWCEATGRIALTLTRNENSEIYSIGRDGKDQKRLTSNRAIDCSPSWSRDGRSLAFTSDRTGSQQIFVMDAATGDARRITFSSNYNDGAAWSPAGPERIAYSARIDGKFQIFTCTPDGKDHTQLTSGWSNNEEPTWSPNGEVIAFMSDRSGSKHIFTMFAADGSNVTQLTNSSSCMSPSWSPKIH